MIKTVLLLGLLLLPACATQTKIQKAKDEAYASAKLDSKMNTPKIQCPDVTCDCSQANNAALDLWRRLQDCLEAGSNDK